MDSGNFATGCLVLLFVFAIGLGFDSFAAQMLLWTLQGYAVFVGFWQALLTVITAELIVGLGAAGGSRATK